ncbi:Regulator of nonsense transcripts 1-like [Durusdinium trenchii]|uniref:Regulator of nonsense transcripts 1-like n=1 Tax=Durusdinium trenchii TaxID=1381693 RepID=A0ABP0QEQ6_9DINO
MFNWASLSQHPKVKWGSGPRIIDPVNPTNNVAKPFRSWGLLRKYARISLEKIKRCDKAWTPNVHCNCNVGNWSDEDDESFQDVPKLSPPNPQEACRVLKKMQLPGPAVEKLLKHGFKSLEVLCRLGREADFVDAGMNKVEARLLAEALQKGGWIFRKLEAEGRLPRDRASTSPPPAQARAGVRGTESDEEGEPDQVTPNMSIRLMCYPAGSPDARCLLFGTLVPVSAGFVPVEQLQPLRDLVKSRNRLLSVINVTIHDSERWWLVQLEAEGARLTVTDSHRIVCIEKGRRLDKPARDLARGDVVQTTFGEYKLSSVEHLYEPAKVVELTLSPDEAFEAFHPPASILSKGQAHSSPSRPLPAAEGARPTRRGGQNLRNATAAANRWMRSDAYSHVDTAYSSDW